METQPPIPGVDEALVAAEQRISEAMGQGVLFVMEIEEEDVS